MPRQLKVNSLLSEKELQEFACFARKLGRSFDDMSRWLLTRGVSVSRGAIFNWKRAIDRAAGIPTAAVVGCRNDVQLRRRLARCVRSLSGVALAGVVMMAECLVNANLANRRTARRLLNARR